MDQIGIYLILFSIIVVLAQVFQKSTIPIALILVITGMVLSYIPLFPVIHLDSSLVLNFFLPLLIYQISSFSSWRDMKKELRPISLLMIGHVIFITILVATVMHALIPDMGWPLAFALGAIISPPDNVAIVSIRETIRIPERIFIILEGEGMLNDAAALTFFRVALAAAVTNTFAPAHAIAGFFGMILGETLYGYVLGTLIGKFRLTITNTTIHLIVSCITPFLAYYPAVKCGGTGVLATAVVGFMIGNQFTLRFTPEYRIAALAFWPALAYSIQAIIFLLVGLDLRSILTRISIIPFHSLALYTFSVIAVVIIGRFIWVYGALIVLPRVLVPSLRQRDPYPPWQYPFIIAWSGVRGGISLAAALAVPIMAFNIEGVEPRDFIVFLVTCVIMMTLVVQGFSLPYILKLLKIDKIGQSERYKEHMSELQARLQMLEAGLEWLNQQNENTKDDKRLQAEIHFHLIEYKRLINQFKHRIHDHDGQATHDEKTEMAQKLSLLIPLIDIERAELARLWSEEKINLRTRNKLIAALDHQIQRHMI